MKVLFKLHIILISCILFSGCAVFKKTEETSEYRIDDKSLEFTSLFLEASQQKVLGNLDAAQHLFQRCLKINKKSAVAHYELSGIYALQDNYAEAYQHSARAFELQPDNIWYGLQKSKLAFGIGMFDEHINTLKKLKKQYPENDDLKYKLSESYIQLKRNPEAIKVLDELEEKNGVVAPISLQKHQLYLQLGQIEKAENELLVLIEKQPQAITPLRYLADLYLRSQQPLKALEVFNNILEIDPNDGQTHFELYDYYHLNNDLNKAFVHLKKAFAVETINIDRKVKLLFSYYETSQAEGLLKNTVYELLDLLVDAHPLDAKSHSVYGDFLYRDNDFKSARLRFLDALKLAPHKYLIWRQVLLIDYELNEYMHLLTDAQEANTYFPSHAELFWFQGLAANRLGNHDEAVIALENGISFVIDNPDFLSQFYSLLGESYNALKQYDKSDKSFENALEINASNAIILNNYAYYLSLRKDKLRKAKNYSQKALEIEPNSVSFLDTYGWILFQLEEYQEAEKYLLQAYDGTGSNNAIIVEHLGDVKSMLNKKDDAIKLWNRAIDLGGDKAYLMKKIQRGSYFVNIED